MRASLLCVTKKSKLRPFRALLDKINIAIRVGVDTLCALLLDGWNCSLIAVVARLDRGHVMGAKAIESFYWKTIFSVLVRVSSLGLFAI